MRHRAALSFSLFVILLAAVWFLRPRPLPTDPRWVVIEAAPVRIGPESPREWAEDDPRPVAGPRYEKTFSATANAVVRLLSIRQEGVKRTWGVFLNDRKLGTLVPDETALEHLVEIPAGALGDGENCLRLEPAKEPDDIVIGPVALIEAGRGDWLAGGTVSIAVTDAADGRPLPSRLTVTRPDGTLVALAASPENEVAVRAGVVYTRQGRATLSLPAGDYIVHAGRGFEWGLAWANVRVQSGRSHDLALSLVREVDTSGWIAVDSHIHTLTHSGHGDATLRERILTIAGEGIELAVATEHNHHADYGPAVEAAGLHGAFATVTGNEVTTKQGHFNAFPIAPGAPVVDHLETDWAKLLPAIRATPGVRVITLNHPRDLHSGFVPLGEAEFDASTGVHRRAADLKIDALEVITSGAMQSDIELLYRDWFALLKRGHRISAVGSSDSHDVTRFLLGQGRTYVAAPDGDPARVDLDRVWSGYEEGRSPRRSAGRWKTWRRRPGRGSRRNAAGRGLGQRSLVDAGGPDRALRERRGASRGDGQRSGPGGGEGTVHLEDPAAPDRHLPRRDRDGSRTDGFLLADPAALPACQPGLHAPGHRIDKSGLDRCGLSGLGERGPLTKVANPLH
jgi:hypothetical protein